VACCRVRVRLLASRSPPVCFLTPRSSQLSCISLLPEHSFRRSVAQLRTSSARGGRRGPPSPFRIPAHSQVLKIQPYSDKAQGLWGEAPGRSDRRVVGSDWDRVSAPEFARAEEKVKCLDVKRTPGHSRSDVLFQRDLLPG